MSKRYKPYPEYKPSGVEWLGVIPKQWEVKRLKNGARLLIEKTCIENEQVIALENIEGWSGNLVETDSAYKGDGIQCVKNDLLFGKLRPYLAKVYQCPNTLVAFGDLLAYRPADNAHSRFIFYTMLTDWFISIVDGSTYGAKMPRANSEFVGNMKLAFPSHPEQRAIASFLDRETGKIDRMIGKQERMIELLKEKRQAVISHAVTKGLNPNAPMKDSGIEWLGEIPEHWDIRTISRSTTKITNGYVGPTRGILFENGVPYIQATHIKKGVVNFDDAYFVRKEWSNAHSKSILREGDVLIVQTGAGTGDVGLVSNNEEGYNCHALIILAPRKGVISGGFLSEVLQSHYGYSKLYSIRTGGMHPHLNCSEVQYVKVPVPPRYEQDAIMEFIKAETSKLDRLGAKAKQAIELMKERRTALISAAVTGKIDVRNEE